MGRFQNRYQESESGSFVSYMNWDDAGITEKQMFNPPKSGRMMIDIVPYIIATKNHPLVAKKKMQIGDLDYMLDVWVHNNVGPNNAQVICLRNFNKTCPICEFRKERLKIGGKDDEQAEALKGKRRVIYNVLDATSDSIKVKIFEVSHFLFEKEVLDEAKAEGERKGLAYLDYADPDEGYTIKCRTSEDDTGKYAYIKFKNISFVHREEGIVTPKLIEKAYPLDSYMNVLTAEEIDALLYSPDELTSSTAEEEEEEPPRRRRTSPSSSMDTDEDEAPRSRRKEKMEEEEEEETPKRRRAADSDDEEDAPTPRRSRSTEEEEEETPRRRPHKNEDDEDDDPPLKSRKRPPDEEDEDDDDPPPKKTQKDKDDCPHGHRFGVDTDKFEECDECKIWDQCASQLKKNKRKDK